MSPRGLTKEYKIKLTVTEAGLVSKGVIALLAERRLVDSVFDKASFQHVHRKLTGFSSILVNIEMII